MAGPMMLSRFEPPLHRLYYHIGFFCRLLFQKNPVADLLSRNFDQARHESKGMSGKIFEVLCRMSCYQIYGMSRYLTFSAYFAYPSRFSLSILSSRNVRITMIMAMIAAVTQTWGVAKTKDMPAQESNTAE